MARGKLRRDRTEVSCIIKYLVFGFNVVFWMVGGAIWAIGIWAWSEKDMFSNLGQVTQVPLDPALFLVIFGGVVFIIGFCGCVGALRENTILLLIYCVLVGLVLIGEIAIAVILFVYKDWFSTSVGVIFFIQLGIAIFLFMQRQWVKEQVETQLKKMIINYRDDIDLQNLIDWVQADWLQCCGVAEPDDWKDNIYFNCSSPSRERCGVPYSCCIPVENEPIKNYQCGYDTLTLMNRGDIIYTKGCLLAGEDWFNKNLIPIAGVAVGIALVQILGICFAQNLRSDILAQKEKWQYPPAASSAYQTG